MRTPFLSIAVVCGIAICLAAGRPSPLPGTPSVGTSSMWITAPGLAPQANDTDRARQLADKIGTVEWLGPLAPIALSPYFGMMCLAAMAQFGNGTWWEGNRFVVDNPVLSEPLVFWIFLLLTLATSLPRFSKVSKPVAQFLDRLETYSALVVLIILRFAVTPTGDTPPETAIALAGTPPVMAAGLLSISYEMLMIVAAALNLMVISTVRFVCELLVWLSPFPTVDALFELANKSLCGSLMALYAFNPYLALLCNVLIFVACAAVYLPVHRRAVYMRALIVDPVLTSLWPQRGELHRGEMVVFNQNRLGSFPSKSRLRLRREGSGWVLRGRTWWFGNKEVELSRNAGPLVVQSGMLVSRIQLAGLQDARLIFSRRYSQTLPDIAGELGLEWAAAGATTKVAPVAPNA